MDLATTGRYFRCLHRDPVFNRGVRMRLVQATIALLASSGLLAQQPASRPPASQSQRLAAGPNASDVLQSIKWRSVGPVNNAGRISAIAGVPGDMTTYYVGAANGGIIKTTNGGTTFEPIFDKQSSSSIGAI